MAKTASASCRIDSKSTRWRNSPPATSHGQRSTVRIKPIANRAAVLLIGAYGHTAFAQSATTFYACVSDKVDIHMRRTTCSEFRAFR